jgi:hypothetical protein
MPTCSAVEALGFSSRASELQTSQIVRHGITTVISMLGFDATSKSVASLVSKTRAFREDGLSNSVANYYAAHHVMHHGFRRHGVIAW